MFGGFFHAAHDIAHKLPGAGGPLGAFHGQPRGLVHIFHIALRFFLDRADGFLHFLGGAHGLFSQFAHLVGHHGETAPGLARARRLNGRIERQQIGLIRHFINDVHDLTDVAGLFAQAGHGFLEMQNGALDRFDGSHRAAHFRFAGNSLPA